MAFSLENKKYPKDEIDRKVNRIAEMLGIQALLIESPGS